MMILGGIELINLKSDFKKPKMFKLPCFLFAVKLYVRINIYSFILYQTFIFLLSMVIRAYTLPTKYRVSYQ